MGLTERGGTKDVVTILVGFNGDHFFIGQNAAHAILHTVLLHETDIQSLWIAGMLVGCREGIDTILISIGGHREEYRVVGPSWGHVLKVVQIKGVESFHCEIVVGLIDLQVVTVVNILSGQSIVQFLAKVVNDGNVLIDSDDIRIIRIDFSLSTNGMSRATTTDGPVDRDGWS